MGMFILGFIVGGFMAIVIMAVLIAKGDDED